MKHAFIRACGDSVGEAKIRFTTWRTVSAFEVSIVTVLLNWLARITCVALTKKTFTRWNVHLGRTVQGAYHREAANWTSEERDFDKDMTVDKGVGTGRSVIHWSETGASWD